MTLIHIDALELPLVAVDGISQAVYPHQAAIWSERATSGVTVLTAKTGTGKTRAAIWPAIEEGHSVVAIYPTNALASDQTRAIHQMFAEAGLRAVVHLPDTDAKALAEAQHCLVPLDADLLDAWQEKWGRSRAETLELLLAGDKRSRVVLTNPDILYLILALRYRAIALAELSHYSTLVIDEFHLYTGVELANALFMIHLAQNLKVFDRTLLLSATTPGALLPLLGSLFQPRVVGMDDEQASGVPAGHRTCIYPVELEIIESGPDRVASVVEAVRRCKARIDGSAKPVREAIPHIPIVVILNSVINAVWLRDELVREGLYKPDEVLEIRGLSNRAIRIPSNQKIVIGTSSITVGVDFDASALVFEASDGAEFLQRLGRLGRHRPGSALFVCESRVATGLKGLDQTTLSRDELETATTRVFPTRSAYEKFPCTKWGLVSVFAMTDNICRRLAEHPGIDDDAVDSGEWLEGVQRTYVERLDAGDEYSRAKRLSQRPWYAQYVRNTYFRSSGPSLEVLDWRETQRRGGNLWLGTYEADLRTVLQRAVGFDYNMNLGKWVLKGYGSFRPVRLSEVRLDAGEVALLGNERTASWQFVVHNGSSYPLFDLFREGSHIYSVVPKSLRPVLDWRLPCFDCGDYIVGFDGTALLLQALYDDARSL